MRTKMAEKIFKSKRCRIKKAAKNLAAEMHFSTNEIVVTNSGTIFVRLSTF